MSLSTSCRSPEVLREVLRFLSLHNLSPLYIKDLSSLKPAANYALRSSAQSLLFVSKVSCSTLEDRTFCSCCTCFMELPAINYKSK